MSELAGMLTGGVAGVAIGEAAAAALEPVFEPIAQDAWKSKPTKVLELGQLAGLVAQALNSVEDVLDDAERNGYDRDQLLSAIQLGLRAPGPPDAEKLYLRAKADPAGSITLAQLHHAYGKAGIEYQYWEALTAAAETTLLSPAELALGIVRSTIKDPGLLVVTLDVKGSNVPQYPTAALDALDEAAAAGINAERLRALVGSIGLPMSTQQAASAYFRNIITLGAYNQSILEGDVRPEWAPFILEQSREILTAHDYVEARLRNWLTSDAEMYAGTALHGMSEPDTDLLFKITGRPIPVHQVTKGQAYLDDQPGGAVTILPDEQLSLEQSNVRPPWYQLAVAANRYTWPGYFVLKALTPGTITVAECASILRWSGWEPTLALQTAQSFAAGTTTAKKITAAQVVAPYDAGQVDRNTTLASLQTIGYSADDAETYLASVDARPVVAARTSALAKVRSLFVAGKLTVAQATAALEGLGVPESAQGGLLAAYEAEAALGAQAPAEGPTETV